jgi:hypothetical protein
MIAAVATGAAAVASVVVVRGRRTPPLEPVPDGARSPGGTSDARDALEERVVQALREDEVAGGAAVDVAALAPDMVELSGEVALREEADRAVRVAQAVSGVRTVVNRLEVEAEVRHAEATRARLADGDPALNERGVHGLRVGMGRRRQSAATDPDRPDDRNERLSGELEAARVAEEELEAPAPESREQQPGE